MFNMSFDTDFDSPNFGKMELNGKETVVAAGERGEDITDSSRNVLENVFEREEGLDFGVSDKLGKLKDSVDYSTSNDSDNYEQSAIDKI